MSVLNENTLIGASAAGDAEALEIDNSLRFEDGSSAYLSRTPSSAGNRKTWTWSGWVKIGSVDTIRELISAGASSTERFEFYIDGSGFITLYQNNASVIDHVQPLANFRDPSSWYHIILSYDTTNATEADRVRIYVNGTLQTAFSTANYPTLNFDPAGINDAKLHTIGKRSYSASRYLDGYLSEVNFIDGQALTPDSFGKTGDYGEWLPIAYSGGYGTNGFHLDFKSSGSLGNDANGSNNFTTTNIAATDQMLDTPSNNFPVMNPLDRGSNGILLSEGNLRQIHGTGYAAVRASMPFPKTGKWYVEYVETQSYRYNGVGGIRPTGGNESLNTSAGNSYFYWGANGLMVGGRGYVIGIGGGTIVQMAYDADTGKTWMGRDNVWWYNTNAIHTGGNPSAGTNPTNTWAANDEDTFWAMYSYAMNGVVNFGQDSSFAGNKTAQGNSDANGIGDFYYAPPTGFLALCTKNLPDATVVPSEHFNTVLYTGNGGTQTIDTEMQNDMTWLKNRTISSGHYIWDSVRTFGDNELSSSTTNAEGFNAAYYTVSKNAEGFDITQTGGGNEVNYSGHLHVAWNWKAGGTGVSNTDGGINSNVSVNNDAGFSIVSYTGIGGSTTVGHGLTIAPDIVLIKIVSTANYWQAWTTAIDGSDDGIRLNSGNAAGGGSGNLTASTFSAGGNVTNLLGSTFIAYAFHSVDGYSKIASYIGNGNADGTFVHLGFKPAFVLLRRADSTSDWLMFDNKRDPDNSSPYKALYPRYSNAEVSSTTKAIDFLSNGMKIRTTDAELNTSGGKYLYLAFAESPFKHSNAR